MAVAVLPRSLIALFPGADRQVTVDGASVAEVFEALDARWPGIGDRLCEAGPSIRAFINVYVDREPAGLGTRVRVDSVIHVLPAVAGG